MTKKIVVIVIMTIMALSVFAFAGCDLSSDLTEYKASAVIAIENHADTKMAENRYAEQGLELIEQAVTAGKTAIDNAMTRSRVDTAVETAKQNIDAIQNEEEEMTETLRQFDLCDPTNFWNGTIDDDFEIDRVIVIMKKTSTYPELELSHFKLDNGESLEYTALKPSTEHLENFRQIAVITLKQHGKQKVVDAIRALEELEFVKTAQPEYIYGTQDD